MTFRSSGDRGREAIFFRLKLGLSASLGRSARLNCAGALVVEEPESVRRERDDMLSTLQICK